MIPGKYVKKSGNEPEKIQQFPGNFSGVNPTVNGSNQWPPSCSIKILLNFYFMLKMNVYRTILDELLDMFKRRCQFSLLEQEFRHV